KDVPEKEAMDYVLGYTCGNDVTAIDLFEKDKILARAKGFDTARPHWNFFRLTGLKR
ncbi:MAG: hypothetical protein FJ015_04960, partial [Chloroflexi bacterium]|nr:hypothetical protein [Chloroflexota bacterium]